MNQPFVGRVDQMRKLFSWLDDAKRSQGSVVLVTGDPSIGKSHLVSEFARQASKSGIRVLSGYCEKGNAPAYWPWEKIIIPLLRDYAAAALKELPFVTKVVAQVFDYDRQILPDIDRPAEV